MILATDREILRKLKGKHGPAKAKGVIAHKFAVTVYHMLKNGQVFDVERFAG